MSSEGQLQMMLAYFRVTAVTAALPGLCLCPVWAPDFHWVGERTYFSQLWRRGLNIREHLDEHLVGAAHWLIDRTSAVWLQVPEESRQLSEAPSSAH